MEKRAPVSVLYEAEPPRIPALDALRGLALAAMFAYHLTWDLGYFGFIDRAIPTSPAFHMFGHAIAVTFLGLVGAGLALASRRRFSWAHWGKRLALIVAAATAITVATWYAFPNSFIFFGILHCIAAATLLATPFIRKPAWMAALIGAFIFALPFAFRAPFFDQPIWWWTGLGTYDPPSNDWRPFFPWVAFGLFGLAAMQAGLARGLPQWLVDWRAHNPLSRLLVFGGRHSLAVYLVHQPVFLAILFVVNAFVAGPVDPEERPFRQQCEAQCVASGADALLCARFCGCVVTETRSVDLWRKVLTNALSPMERERLDAITQQCSRSAANATGR
jgi:uncharacterized membrane protein